MRLYSQGILTFGQRVQFSQHGNASPDLPLDRVKVIGYPRFDGWFAGATRPAWLLPKAVLLWLPTWGQNSSIARFTDAIFALSDRYEIWVKPHHCMATMEEKRMEYLRRGPVRMIEFTDTNESSLGAADIVLADLSSGAFSEAVFLGKKVVALTSEAEYRRTLVPIPGVPIIREPERLAPIFATWQFDELCPRRCVDEWFDSTHGHDGERAAQIIIDCVAKAERVA